MTGACLIALPDWESKPADVFLDRRKESLPVSSAKAASLYDARQYLTRSRAEKIAAPELVIGFWVE